MSLFDDKRAVIFDLGGTLIEFESEQWDELERKGMRNCYEFLSRNGFDLPDAEEMAERFVEYHQQKWKVIQKDHKEVTFDRLGSEFLSRYDIDLGDAISDFVRAFYAPISELVHRIDGTIETLEFVKASGLKIGLVSNTGFPAEWHRDEMRRFEIYDYFDYTVFSSEFGIRKPDPSMFRDCLGKLGVNAGEAVHVGDRPYEDISGAKNMGITSVLLRRPDREMLSQFKPDIVIDNLKELVSQ
jgi:putative hydrolase of the HAD superfamily